MTRRLAIILVAVLLALASTDAPARRLPATPADLAWTVVTTPAALATVVTLDLPADRYPGLYRLAEPIERPGADRAFRP